MADANDPTAHPEKPEPEVLPTAVTPAAPPQPGDRAETPPAEQVREGAPPAAPAESIPLPPPRPEPAPVRTDRLEREVRLLDRLTVAVLLGLTFLLGSFAVQNADFWMHLATGRLLARGDYAFGDNPYSHPQTPYWANHAWLFDWGLYGLSLVGGGVETPVGQAILVVVKALLMVLLAWVLLGVRRPGQSLWVPAVMTGLAMLVLSTRMFLQPAVLSFLFLGLTVYLLTRPYRAEAPAGEGLGGAGSWLADRPVWLLPPLFVLWVNVDDWFILGPLTVALFLLGELLQNAFAPIRTGPDARPAGYPKTLGLVLAVGLVACLINPFHYHAFTLPPELSYLAAEASDGLGIDLPAGLTDAGRTLQTLHQQDPANFPRSAVSLSPLSSPYLRVVLAVPRLSYFVLLLASLASFALNLGTWRWGRFLVWLVFALWSLVQIRALPFFAVAAAPLAALNLQDIVADTFANRARADGPWRLASLGGRAATVLLGLVLAVLAWPGWLHDYADDPARTHRVAWKVEEDPRLRGIAEQLARLGGGGRPVHVLNFSPDLAPYCAWYCPGGKTYLDTFRFELFTDRAGDYARARSSLADPREKPAWQRVLRGQGVNWVALGPTPENLTARALVRFWSQPDRWVQPGVGSISTLFAWKDPARAGKPFPGPALDLSALAFAADTPDRAPAAGADFEPRALGGWSAFVQGPVPDPWDVYASQLYQVFFQIDAQRRPPLAPGAPAVLAVRAARRGVARAPADPAAYYTLAKAYLHLWKNQEDPWSVHQPTELTSFPRLVSNNYRQMLREVLVVTALNRALALHPPPRDRVEIHRQLALIFGRQTHYLDAGLRHMREYEAALVKHSTPVRGAEEGDKAFRERQRQFKQQSESLRRQVKGMEEEVGRRRKEYRLQATGQGVPERVQIALFYPCPMPNQPADQYGFGLADEALDLLLKARPEKMSVDAVLWQIDLLLTLGRADEARERLPDLAGLLERLDKQSRTPGQDARLLVERAKLQFHLAWFQALLAAADGDYARAEAELARFQSALRAGRRFLEVESGQILSLAGFFAQVANRPIANPWVLTFLQGLRARVTAELTGQLRFQSEVTLLRGLLALERGRTAEAAGLFERAFRVGRDMVTTELRYFEPLIARQYLALMQRLKAKK